MDITKDEFLKLAEAAYNKAVAKQRENYFIMTGKKFPYGTLVYDRQLERHGIIVGHYDVDGIQRGDQDMYRVYYNKTIEYMGVPAYLLSKAVIPTPEHLQDVTWNEINEVRVHLRT